jgi:hypothetical protein
MAKDKDGAPVTEQPQLGKLKSGFWRCKVLRNHDGADAFYQAGTVADVWGPYAASQIEGKSVDGTKFKVEPPVFEVLEKA